jgi:hypothetical protein
LRWTWPHLQESHFCGSSACSATAWESLKISFFATVFLASGLLFVACMFAAAALMGVLIESVAASNIDSATYYFGRRITDALINLFAMKMAGVFMVLACTIGLCTAIYPRWVAFSGYACALALLVVIANWRWITLVFPIWMLLVSAQILLAEFTLMVRRGPLWDTSAVSTT